MVHDVNNPGATPVLVEELMQSQRPDSNIELKLDATVTAIEGKDLVEQVIIQNVKTGQTETVPAMGFIFVGWFPIPVFWLVVE